MADESTNVNEGAPSENAAPIVSTEPATTPTSPVSNPTGNGKKKLSLAIIIAAVVVVLGGASAGAYYGVIVPNKPENVLKSATKNLLEQHQATAKGNLNVDLKAADAPIKNVTVNFTSASDTDQHVFDVNLEGEVSGVKLPLELRGVDKSLYFKVGDLSTIKSVASLADPSVGSIVDTLSSKLSNQWIEIDQSLLKQANLECSMDSINSLSKKDIDDLMKLYGNNKFVTIKNSAKDSVEGKSATRYELGIDRSKVEAFGKQLNTIDGLKKASDCVKQASDKASEEGDKEVKPDTSDATATFNIWVDGSKHIRQIQLKGSDKDTDATVTITFTEGKVDVKKPDGAKPLMQVIGDFSQLFGGFPVSGLSNPSSSGSSGLSAACQAELQQSITNQSFEPSESCLSELSQ